MTRARALCLQMLRQAALLTRFFVVMARIVSPSLLGVLHRLHDCTANVLHTVTSNAIPKGYVSHGVLSVCHK